MGDYGEDEPPEGLSETEAVMWKKRKQQLEVDEEELREYMQQREEERVRLEEELIELKERQAQRREEREEDDRHMEEMRRAQEEQRKQDEEERKIKNEAEKRRKEAERKKKQAMMAGGGMGGLMSAKGDGKPNFVIPTKKDDDGAKPAPKMDPGMSKEDAAVAKEAYMARFLAPFDGEDKECSELRMLIKGMFENIVKLEAAKYDMEERGKIQDYDLKELRERAKQQARQKAIKKGLDPNEYANQKHPPKKAVSSQYDRQIDRRSYGDRMTMFKEELKMDGRPINPAPKKIFHGSCRPPDDFGRPATKLEELEVIRKNMEPPKYQEAAPVEDAKPPMACVKAGPVPEDEPEPEPRKLPPPQLQEAPAPPAAEPEPEPEATEEEEEEE